MPQIICSLALYRQVYLVIIIKKDILILFSPLVTLLFVVRASLSSTAFIPNNEDTGTKQ